MRGEHPERAPLYGGALLLVVMGGGTATYELRQHLPLWLLWVIGLALTFIGILGMLLTLRDYS